MILVLGGALSSGGCPCGGLPYAPVDASELTLPLQPEGRRGRKGEKEGGEREGEGEGKERGRGRGERARGRGEKEGR